MYVFHLKFMQKTQEKELLSLQNGCHVFDKKSRSQTASWDVTSWKQSMFSSSYLERHTDQCWWSHSWEEPSGGPWRGAACSPWGHGWPLTSPDSQPPCHPAVQRAELGSNYSADNRLQLYIQVPESGRRGMAAAGRGWGEVKKSQDKPLFDTFLWESMAALCVPWTGAHTTLESGCSLIQNTRRHDFPQL